MSDKSTANWNIKEIKNHLEAARRLIRIKDQVFLYLGKNRAATERQVLRFILRLYREHGLATDQDLAIVAFGENTGNVHHYPPKINSRRLSQGTLIMIDLWARLDRPGAPFADLTWMGYRGRSVPAKIRRVFDLVRTARDKAFVYIEQELRQGRLPAGRKVDAVARGLIGRQGLAKRFLHNTGHCLGFRSPHGDGPGLTALNKNPLALNLGYTIEPGIYFAKKFGVRSEIDFYINSKKQPIITTEVQKEITII